MATVPVQDIPPFFTFAPTRKVTVGVSYSFSFFLSDETKRTKKFLAIKGIEYHLDTG